MNNESQPKKVKSCVSCKRTLPLFYFGLRKCSTDGYNYTCKECRNFKKRQTYNSDAIEQTQIMSLYDYNYLFIRNMPVFNLSCALVGLDLDSCKTIRVEIGQLSCLGLISIYYENNSKAGVPYSGQLIDNVDFIVKFLSDKKIRLFYSHEIDALKNWGYITNI